MSFETDVLRPIQRLLGPQVRAPAGVTWTHQCQDHGHRIVANVGVDQLCKNFQTDSCAAPVFLMAFAFWLERVTGQQVRCRLVVEGDPPPLETAPRLHWHRSLFLIEEMERLLGDRFESHVPERWAWPALPALNHAVGPRQTEAGDGGHHERRLETSICESPTALDAFSQHIEPIVSFQRQLPVGLFDGRVSRGSRWTPGGSSQIDLWAPSCDGNTVHLFELKVAGNVKLGIVPEALYYARLIHYFRVGHAPGAIVAGDGDALNAIRAAERIRMWLAVPEVHPLVRRGKDSPLSWLNAGPSADVQVGVLPLMVGEDGTFVRWQFDDRWPPV